MSPLSRFVHFSFALCCVRCPSFSCGLACLCIPLLIRLLFLPSLLRRAFFLPYAFHVVLSFVCFILLLFSFLGDFFLLVSNVVPSCRRCWLLSSSPFPPFPSAFTVLFFFSERVPGLVWFGSVYRVTTPGFVADHLIIVKKTRRWNCVPYVHIGPYNCFEPLLCTTVAT